MGAGILLYRAALFLIGLIVAWLLYRFLILLGSKILPHRPRIVRTISAALVLLFPPALALGAWIRMADLPLVDILQRAPERFSLGILNEHPAFRNESALLLRLLHDHPRRMTHLDIAVAEPEALSSARVPRKFWRFRYRKDSQLCLDRKSYRRLPLFGNMPPPLPFRGIHRNSTGCLTAQMLDDPNTFSIYIFNPIAGWQMRTLGSVLPFLRIERGTIPFIIRRHPHGTGVTTLLQIHRILIHWGFWSPKPIFSFEEFPDNKRVISEWLEKKSTR